MLRYLTSGESHGQSLITIIDGIPSNIELNIDEINEELKKRQGGYGRGGRMKIEKDKINIIGGVRGDRKSTRLNSSHSDRSRMPSSA